MTTQAQEPPGPAAPLQGLKIVEIGHSVAGPFTGLVLADLGATLIKVENPNGGDDARNWGPPFWDGASAIFQCMNRNKASVTVDLKDPQERELLKALIGEADVVIQNMRPGLVEQYGIDSASLRREHPSLIYFNLGAFGDVGPLNQRPGYDPLMQAFGGIMNITGEPDRPPVRVGPSIIDIGSALWGVIGILAALVRRRETGEGCTIDGSLFETALSWMTIPIASALASGKEPGRTGSEAVIQVPSKAFAAADGYVVIAAGNDNLFRRLCLTLGKAEWADDPRFLTNPDRVANRAILNPLIEAVIGTAGSQHWANRLGEAGVPCAATQTVSEVIAHPQTKALEMLAVQPDGAMAFVNLPIKFDGERPKIRCGPPELGAQNAILEAVKLKMKSALRSKID
jgi:crotonobetainyl-CoA:carnitine CoA-transferase CaiB-like acyl-CoA transferase